MWWPYVEEIALDLELEDHERPYVPAERHTDAAPRVRGSLMFTPPRSTPPAFGSGPKQVGARREVMGRTTWPPCRCADCKVRRVEAIEEVRHQYL